FVATHAVAGHGGDVDAHDLALRARLVAVAVSGLTVAVSGHPVAIAITIAVAGHPVAVAGTGLAGLVTIAITHGRARRQRRDGVGARGRAIVTTGAGEQESGQAGKHGRASSHDRDPITGCRTRARHLRRRWAGCGDGPARSPWIGLAPWLRPHHARPLRA